MQRTGILVISSNVAQINGVRLARNAAVDPFGAAINFLANRGIGAGDFISVTGTDGFINSTAVMNITGAAQGLSTSVVLGSAKAASVGAAGAVKSAGKKTKKGGSKKGGSKKTKQGGSKKSSKKSASKKSGKKSASAKKAAGKKAAGKKSGNK